MSYNYYQYFKTLLLLVRSCFVCSTEHLLSDLPPSATFPGEIFSRPTESIARTAEPSKQIALDEERGYICEVERFLPAAVVPLRTRFPYLIVVGFFAGSYLVHTTKPSYKIVIQRNEEISQSLQKGSIHFDPCCRNRHLLGHSHYTSLSMDTTEGKKLFA